MRRSSYGGLVTTKSMHRGSSPSLSVPVAPATVYVAASARANKTGNLHHRHLTFRSTGRRKRRSGDVVVIRLPSSSTCWAIRRSAIAQYSGLISSPKPAPQFLCCLCRCSAAAERISTKSPCLLHVAMWSRPAAPVFCHAEWLAHAFVADACLPDILFPRRSRQSNTQA